MITQRRVFQAKPGMGGAVVAKMKEFDAISSNQDGPPRRIYSDLFSGRTDRVAWEFDVESLAHLETMFRETTQDAGTRKAYEDWYEGLKPLIEGATVELWIRQD